MRMKLLTALGLGLLLAVQLVHTAALESAIVNGDGIRLEFDARMHSRVVATFAGEKALGPFEDSETLLTATGPLGDFALEGKDEAPVSDALGNGRRVTLTGHAGKIAKRVEVTSYAARPRWLFVSVRYINEGDTPLAVTGWTSNRYVLDAPGDATEPAFWSYQSGSYEKRPDWVLAAHARLHAAELPRHERHRLRRRHAGRRRVAARRRPRCGTRGAGAQAGVASGHAAPGRQRGARACSARRATTLAAWQAASTRSARSSRVHRGDHFDTLRAYSEAMQAQGIKLPDAPKDAFEPIWCAWGYGRDFTPEQVFETLPVATRLGFRWATLDDGWQVAEGDWTPVATKFPNGDADMKALVDRIHAAGMKAQLWWSPLGADPGSRTDSEHPDWLLRNEDGSPQKISWWDDNYLCPAFGPRPRGRSRLRQKGARPVGIRRPQDRRPAPERRAALLQPGPRTRGAGRRRRRRARILQSDLGCGAGTKPGALVEICPCGTAYSFFTHAVPQHAGRLRSGELVAGPPQRQDAEGAGRRPPRLLRRSRGDERGRHRLRLHLRHRRRDRHQLRLARRAAARKTRSSSSRRRRRDLGEVDRSSTTRSASAEGEYLGSLYDIGFDRPEAHVVRKGDALYYAFFAPTFDGSLELRGLDARAYRLTDYVNGRDLGVVQGPTAKIPARFEQSLLIEARPERAAAPAAQRN